MKKMSKALATSCPLSWKAWPQGLPNKAVFLVLLWSFVSYLVISSLILTAGTGKSFQFIIAISCAFSPVTGWLADVYLGRYKMVSYSIRLLFSVAVFLNVYYIINDNMAISHSIQMAIEAIVTGLVCIGYVGILVNGIQLSMDQMSDASSADVSSFITWYVWAYDLAFCIAVLSQHCFCDTLSLGVTFFLIPFAMAVCVISDGTLNHWLIKEPVTSNPLRLVYNVLHFAAKNKHPRMRSSFTYWDDKPYSRIDLGKAKYGGPFTTEQVEDVKTFFRLIALVAACGLVMAVYAFQSPVQAKLMLHYVDDKYLERCEGHSMKEYLSNCYGRIVVQHFYHFSVVVLVPVFKLLLQPALLKCARFANAFANSWFNLILGGLLFFLSILQQLAIEVSASLSSAGANATCLFYASRQGLKLHEGLPLNYHWIIVPQTFFGMAFFLARIASFQFVIAQAPYAMRSQLIGLLFSVYAILSVSMTLLLQVVGKGIKPQGNCGVWLYTAMAILSFLLLIFLFVVKRCYSPRRRDEDVHNEQMFAVNYYDKYLPLHTSTN